MNNTLAKQDNEGHGKHKAPPALSLGALKGADLPRLTAQQMAFVEALTSGEHSYTTAYLEAYPTAKSWPKTAQWSAASRSARHSKITVWLNAAYQAKALAVDRSTHGHLSRLETAQHKALQIGEELEPKDKLNAIKVALDAEKQHAAALGIGQERMTADVTVNLVSFGDQEVSKPETVVLEHDKD